MSVQTIGTRTEVPQPQVLTREELLIRTEAVLECRIMRLRQFGKDITKAEAIQLLVAEIRRMVFGDV